MSYMVIWMRKALDELTNLWMNADSETRDEITAAAHRIDAKLLDQPETKGESRADGERILIERPLGVLFHVKAGAVRIFRVWLPRRRSRPKD
jgi:hypothetical protein